MLKKFVLLMLLVTMALGVTACGWSQVDPGHVGIKVNKFGGDKGVEEKELTNGWYWTGFTYRIYEFPIYQQNLQWSKSPHEGKKIDQSITFQCDGMLINADMGCIFTLEQSKVPVLFQKFRQGVEEISDGYLRQIIRDVLNRKAAGMKIEAMYGNLTGFMAEVTAEVQKEVSPLGINIQTITVGEVRLPGPVLDAINAKVTSTQKAIQAENELRETTAQANKVAAKAEGEARAILVEAKAQAAANQLINASITPTLVQYKSIEKWNGVLPTVSGGATPIINMSDLMGHKAK